MLLPDITDSSEPVGKVVATDGQLEDIKKQLHADGDVDFDQLVADARAATALEHEMSFKQALRKYPMAVFYSWMLSCCIIMTGYDVVLLGSLYAQPAFTRRFGVPLPDGRYTVTAAWQAGLSNGQKCGEVIGLAVNGFVTERIGSRKTVMGALFAVICFIPIITFAINIEMLLVGNILMGVCWGFFETLTVSYAAEIAPVRLRPYLTAYVNLCWVIGQIIGSGVLRGCLDIQSEWGFRIPFALQWIWPVPILIGCFFAPDSPWWQVRRGKLDLARKTIKRLKHDATDAEIEAQLAMIMHTNALEKTVAAGTSYWDCFKGIDRRRTEIAAGVWMIQNLCGSAFMGYSTYFLEQAGLATSNAFNMSIAQYALGMVGTICSWLLMSRFGRRPLYFYGLVILALMLMIIGGLGCTPEDSSASWGVGAMLLVYTAVYDATIGPVCYTLVAEISSTRLRAKTVVIARIAYNLVAIVNGVIMPQFLNEQNLDWGAKTGFFWGGMCCLCALWTYFRCPEPRGRTYGELDVLFQQRVSARRFAKTEVDQFADHGLTRTGSDFLEEKGEKGTIATKEHAAMRDL
ncbi:hypothetical protein JCM10207_000064 [Rhodosporidiobolus poonsookiae]